jgi:hypothetical protein
MSLKPPLLAIRSLAGALGLAFAASVATAADYATRDVGPWVVASSSDGQGCFLTRTYPSPRATTVQFGLDIDGSNRLTLLNANWSIEDRERLRLTFRFSDAAFPRHLAVGIASEGKKGFVTSFGATFPRTFATSNILHVKRGDVPVEELALDGSGAAVAELNRCVDRHRATATPRPVSRDKGRIPVDPFAAKGKRDSR